ncbi:MAG TPA: hypothetical protein VGD90_06040 [Sphingobacteriaceae bacterium]
MIRRDFIQAEIQKLAQVLARIIGLKRDGRPDQAYELLKHSLSEHFDFNMDDLRELSTPDFLEELRKKNFPAEKADLLAQYLLEAVQPLQSQDPNARKILEKVLALFDFLEQEHHRQTLENLQRRSAIDKFLKESNE